MHVKQVDIFYNENTPLIFETLFKPLQSLASAQLFSKWSISREWANGPHFRLILDCSDFFCTDALVEAMVGRCGEFLSEFPSPPLDKDTYLAKQRKLIEVEKSPVDPDYIHENNSLRVNTVPVTSLSAKYESTDQWLSVFEANCAVRPTLISLGANSLDEEQKEKQLFTLMMVLAAVYQPKPSSEDELEEYNGFLSYFSNYTFWHHSLPVNAQQKIETDFNAYYNAYHMRYQNWLTELTNNLSQQEGLANRYADWIKFQFRRFTQMACEEKIHWRSPFPKNRLADINKVSPFHRQFFYTATGEGSPFPTDFSSYRWLLNIVYRLFPTLNFTPLDRQRFNYSLSRFERENRSAVYELRSALYESS